MQRPPLLADVERRDEALHGPTWRRRARHADRPCAIAAAANRGKRTRTSSIWDKRPDEGSNRVGVRPGMCTSWPGVRNHAVSCASRKRRSLDFQRMLTSPVTTTAIHRFRPVSLQATVLSVKAMARGGANRSEGGACGDRRVWSGVTALSGSRAVATGGVNQSAFTTQIPIMLRLNLEPAHTTADASTRALHTLPLSLSLYARPGARSARILEIRLRHVGGIDLRPHPSLAKPTPVKCWATPLVLWFRVPLRDGPVVPTDAVDRQKECSQSCPRRGSQRVPLVRRRASRCHEDLGVSMGGLLQMHRRPPWRPCRNRPLSAAPSALVLTARPPLFAHVDRSATSSTFQHLYADTLGAAGPLLPAGLLCKCGTAKLATSQEKHHYSAKEAAYRATSARFGPA